MFILLLGICFSEHLYHNTVWFMHTLQQGRQMNQIFHRMRWPHAFKRNFILRIFVRDKTLPLTASCNPEPMSVQMTNYITIYWQCLISSSSFQEPPLRFTYFLGASQWLGALAILIPAGPRSRLHFIRMWDGKRTQSLFTCLCVSTKERLLHLLHSNGISEEKQIREGNLYRAAQSTISWQGLRIAVEKRPL